MLAISEAFYSQDSNSATYERVLDVIQDVLGYSSCSIHLLEPRGQFVYLAASRGIPEGFPDTVMQVVKIEDLSESYMQPLIDRKPYRPVEYRTGNEVTDEGVLKGDIVKIPLVAKDALIGSLTIVRNEASREWFDAEQRWLEIIGCQIGTLIEQMTTYQQFQNAAILQERERVSQELHDNLSQFVGTIRLLAERISEDVKADNLTRVKDDAESLESISRDAYASIREEMMGLRYIQDPNQDSISAVKDYVERFERQWGITTVFNVLGPQNPPFLAPRSGIQLFRIIQEALTNVRRHAQATQVIVSVEKREDTLVVQVNDNGVGFITKGIPDIKLGLRIMRERACDVGGILQVASNPGVGTTVQVEIPLDISGRIEVRHD